MYLGNLTIEEFLNRTKYNIDNIEDLKWLKSHRQDDAHIKFDSDKFHIFDIPFCIHASEKIINKIINLLQKYEMKSKSKEMYTIFRITENEEKKYMREIIDNKIAEKKAREEDPKSIWNIKWNMLIPVTVDNKNLFYGCFINTYTTGYTNIPNMINGRVRISRDEDGLHGKFILHNSEKDNDANPDSSYRYVIGLGLYDETGMLINSKNYTFKEVDYNIADGINNWESIKGNKNEIHFYL